MNDLSTPLFIFNLLVVLPIELYALIRGINVQRYNLGIAKGRRYRQGFWWRQATALAKSRGNKGANFIVTVLLSGAWALLSLLAGSYLDVAITVYVFVNALIPAAFLATQLPVIEAEQTAAVAE